MSLNHTADAQVLLLQRQHENLAILSFMCVLKLRSGERDQKRASDSTVSMCSQLGRQGQLPNVPTQSHLDGTWVVLGTCE